MTHAMLAQMAMVLLRDGTAVKTMVLLTMATLTLMLGWGDEQEKVLIGEAPHRTPWAEGPQIGL